MIKATSELMPSATLLASLPAETPASLPESPTVMRWQQILEKTDQNMSKETRESGPLSSQAWFGVSPGEGSFAKNPGTTSFFTGQPEITQSNQTIHEPIQNFTDTIQQTNVSVTSVAIPAPDFTPSQTPPSAEFSARAVGGDKPLNHPAPPAADPTRMAQLLTGRPVPAESFHPAGGPFRDTLVGDQTAFHEVSSRIAGGASWETRDLPQSDEEVALAGFSAMSLGDQILRGLQPSISATAPTATDEARTDIIQLAEQLTSHILVSDPETKGPREVRIQLHEGLAAGAEFRISYDALGQIQVVVSVLPGGMPFWSQHRDNLQRHLRERLKDAVRVEIDEMGGETSQGTEEATRVFSAERSQAGRG